MVEKTLCQTLGISQKLSIDKLEPYAIPKQGIGEGLEL